MAYSYKDILGIIRANECNISAIKTAKKYYLSDNDINIKGICSTSKEAVKDNMLRNADNRISHHFHGLLVDEKAGYMFTYPPTIDIDDNQNGANEVIQEALGTLETTLKDLCIEASNCGVAWIHYWINKDNNFKWAKVDTEQCIPIYAVGLEEHLEGFIRNYKGSEYNTVSQKYEPVEYIEYWTDSEFIKYICRNERKKVTSEKVRHNLGRVPFIRFKNNMHGTPDLQKYKKQIDLYDKVISGYANDIEDIQQILYILVNYSGHDDEFLNNLRRYKKINLSDNEIEGHGDFKTMQIDIPVEARKVLLQELKEQIYEFGQGLKPDIESVGNASGVTLKFFYRKLELKAGNLETEFKKGVEELIRAVARHLNIKCGKVQQTYNRNMIASDIEISQIARESYGEIPLKYILRHHPWVDDPAEAQRIIEEEEKKRRKRLTEDYSDIFINEDIKKNDE